MRVLKIVAVSSVCALFFVLFGTPSAKACTAIGLIDYAACNVPAFQALQRIAEGNIENQLNLAVIENRAGGAAAAPLTLFPTGRLARTTHDGYVTSLNGTPVPRSPGFKTDEASVFGTLEINMSQWTPSGANWKINIFGGYAEIDSDFDPVNGSTRGGSFAKNESLIYGVSSILSAGSTYMVVALTGFTGDTSGQIVGATAAGDANIKYDTHGIVGAATVGHSFAIGGDWYFDPRAGFSYGRFDGDDYVANRNVAVLNTMYRAAAVNGSIGFFGKMTWGSMAFSPYVRGGVEERVTYDNEALVTTGVGRFLFGEDSTFWNASLGFNLQATAKMSVNAELYGRWSDDVETLGGKLGAKFRF